MWMDRSMGPSEWHRRLHCRTDGPLPTKLHVHKFTRASSKFNLSSSPTQYVRILPLDREVNKGSHLLHFISKDKRPASAQTTHNNGTTLLLQTRNAFVSPPVASWSYLSHCIWTPVVCIIYRTLWKLCLRTPGPGHSKSRSFYTTVLEHSFRGLKLPGFVLLTSDIRVLRLAYHPTIIAKLSMEETVLNPLGQPIYSV